MLTFECIEQFKNEPPNLKKKWKNENTKKEFILNSIVFLRTKYHPTISRHIHEQMNKQMVAQTDGQAAEHTDGFAEWQYPSQQTLDEDE